MVYMKLCDQNTLHSAAWVTRHMFIVVMVKAASTMGAN